MNELDWCESLGILWDPDQNRLPIDAELTDQIIRLSRVFPQMVEQKAQYGIFNPDVWLEFVPWHSLN